MSDSANPWAGAVGVWVPLAQLLDTVERELGIPREPAAKALRLPLESYGIHTIVVDWWRRRNDGNSAESRWVAEGHPGSPYSQCVSQQGWEHVDRAKGTLAGCEVRVCWPHVERELELLAREYRKKATMPKSEPARAAGGAPEKHDWDMFWIGIALYASEHDLFEVPRTDLQRHMQQWTAENMRDPAPNPAAIRSRLKRLYEKVDAARNAPNLG